MLTCILSLEDSYCFLLSPLLQLMVPMICSIIFPLSDNFTGHLYGMGAFWALLHDYRVMRNDRGWFCFPEIFVHEPISKDLILLARYLQYLIMVLFDCCIEPRYPPHIWFLA